MNKYGIRAFTIMEITVAMLLASIVIGITYSVYTIVVHSYISFNDKSKNSAVLIRLDELLKKDFAKSDGVLKVQNGVLFRYRDREVNYEIDSGFVVRKSEITDTFRVKTQKLITTFEAQPVSGTADETEQNRIDGMELILLLDKESVAYHYHKQYSSVNLIQRNPNAVN